MADVAACRYDAGISKLDEARALVPARNVTYNIARAYQEIGNRPNAIRYYRDYLGTAPCDRNRVAPVLAKLEESEAANAAASPPRADLRACARRLFYEGMTEIADKRYEAGIIKLKEANDAMPARNVLYNISRAYRDEGDLEKSVDYLRKYAETNPSDRDKADQEIKDIEQQIAKNGQ